MRNVIHTDAPEVRNIAAMAFPDYTGRKFQVSAFEGPQRLDSCWSDGSRDYFALVNIITGKQVPIPENGTPFSNGGQIFQLSELPEGCALVEHSISCGKDMGIRIQVRPDNLNRLALPAPATLTKGQIAVLVFTYEKKSSYNGRNRQQMALDEIGMPESEWNQAKAELIALGLLKSNGAITDQGKNAKNAAHSGQCWNLPKWQA